MNFKLKRLLRPGTLVLTLKQLMQSDTTVKRGRRGDHQLLALHAQQKSNSTRRRDGGEDEPVTFSFIEWFPQCAFEDVNK